MLVLMDEPVSAKVIEGAAVSARPVWPNTYLVFGGFGVLGIVMGYVTFGAVQAGRVSRYLSSKHRRALSYTRWFKDDGSNNNVDYEERRRSILKDITGVRPRGFEKDSG